MDYLNELFGSLTARFGALLPSVLGALVVLIIGFIIAGIVRRISKKLIAKTKIDDRLVSGSKSNFSISAFVSTLLYYLVLLYTLIIVLDMMGVQNVLEPLQNLINDFIGFLPNVIAAGIIAFAGYIIGKIASEATGFVSERLDAYGDKMGLSTGTVDLPNILKQMVFLIIFIPILIVALDALNMEAISAPATEMLGSFMDAIPRIIGAAILFGVFFIAGKYISSVISNLLENMGINGTSERIGISNVLGHTSLSKLIGNVIFYFILFTGLIAAADKLVLPEVQMVLRDILDIAGSVFFGIIIILAGIFISNIAVDMLSKSDNSAWMVPITRFALMGIFLAFALHTMGIAESIVNLAFGLTLGAIAVAFALSFGLGGRDAAGKQMDYFFKKIRD